MAEHEKRPAWITDAMVAYLDGLRKSGVVNMLGATPYIQEEFELLREEAVEVLAWWQRTYDGNR
jgi:hypothetical protein